MLKNIAGNAGGVPLGYLTQAAFLKLFGYSVIAARLPSIVSAVLAFLGFGLLALQMNLRKPLLAAVLFAFLPLHFRYAFEARPYEQALCFTVWLTVLFLRIVSHPQLTAAILCAFLTAAAIYTQPFTIFIPISHVLVLAFTWADQRTKLLRTALILASLATLIGGLAFAPWFVYARPLWQHAIANAADSHIDLRTLLVIAKEMTGAGYFGTALILPIAGLGLLACNKQQRVFCSTMLLIPLVFTLIADSVFGYFFAIRQLIFVLPALSLLLAFGLQRLWDSPFMFTKPTVLLLFVTMVYSNGRALIKPRENWQSAANLISFQLQNRSSCYAGMPGDATKLIEFFASDLREHNCSAADLQSNGRVRNVIIIRSPYLTPADLAQEKAHPLAGRGFHFVRSSTSQPLIQIWTH